MGPWSGSPEAPEPALPGNQHLKVRVSRPRHRLCSGPHGSILRGDPTYCRMFNSIPGRYSLHTSTIHYPQLPATKNVSRHCPMSPPQGEGQNRPQLRPTYRRELDGGGICQKALRSGCNFLRATTGAHELHLLPPISHPCPIL